MKMKAKYQFAVMGTSLLLILLAGCGGGGGGGGSSETDSTEDNPPITENTDNAPQISGFDFEIAEGDFWQYGWRYKTSSYAQGSSGSSSDTSGEFRITLGSPETIAGATAYPMLFSGQAQNNSDLLEVTRWTHIAIAGNKISVSADGVSLQEIFDAQDGTMLGTGFFSKISGSDSLFSATSGSLNNEFFSGAAYQVSVSRSEGQCEYFPEVGQTICGSDTQTNFQEREYYQANTGPVGLYYHSSFSSDGGGFSSGSSKTLDIGMIASSLRSDTVDYLLETEPNNVQAQAYSITLPSTVKGGFYQESDHGATETVTLRAVAEIEPDNSSNASPQSVSLPTYVSADISDSDQGQQFTITDFPSAGSDHVMSVEDWFYFEAQESAQLDIELDFTNAENADLDLYVFVFGSNSRLVASSINDNLETDTENLENISFFVDPGEAYWIAVDAWATNGDSVNYGLSIASNNAATKFEPSDWYQVELESQSPITVNATGGAGLLLTDDSGDIVAYDLPTSCCDDVTNMTTGVLEPGSYRIGVIYYNAHSSFTYELTVGTGTIATN